MEEDPSLKNDKIPSTNSTYNVRNNNTNLATSFFSRPWYAYVNSPLNFSSVTGWRYPGIPRLLGNPISGRVGSITKKNGLLSDLIEAGQLARNHSTGMVYYWMGNKLVLLITQPNHIQEVLVKNSRNTSRKAMEEPLKILGSNIVSDPHDVWLKKRAVYRNTLFKTRSLLEAEPHTINNVNKLLQKLDNSSGQILNCKDLFSEFLLNSLFERLIGVTPDFTNAQRTDLFKYLEKIEVEVTSAKGLAKGQLPYIFRNFYYYRGEENNADVLKVKFRAAFKDLLLGPNSEILENKESFLKSIGNVKGKKCSLDTNEDIFGDGNIFLIASYDTTLSTLLFAVKLLCANPRVEHKLREEIYQYCPEEKDLSVNNVNKINYLEMVIKETLRLYPPLPILFPRHVENPFSVAGIPVFKGDTILISPYLTHQLSELFENPDQFFPERFAEEKSNQLYTFLSFGEGPNKCIGRRFAFQQLKLILAAIYRQYHLKIDQNNFEIDIKQGTIKPEYPPLAQFVRVSSLELQNTARNLPLSHPF